MYIPGQRHCYELACWCIYVHPGPLTFPIAKRYVVHNKLLEGGCMSHIIYDAVGSILC